MSDEEPTIPPAPRTPPPYVPPASTPPPPYTPPRQAPQAPQGPPSWGAPAGPPAPGPGYQPYPPSSQGGYGAQPPYGSQPGYGSGSPYGSPQLPPSPPKRTGLVVGLAVVGVLVLVGAGTGIALAVSGGDDQPNATSSASDSPTESATESGSSSEAPPTDTEASPTTEATEPTEPASPTAPPADGALPVGTAGELTDYKVTLTGVETDGDAAIKAENSYNEPPSNGRYVIASWKATYTGSTKGQVAFDVHTTLLGGDKLDYNDYDCGAVVPESAIGVPDLRNGGTVTFNTCYNVPVKAVDGLQVAAATGYTEGSEVIWAP